ncbi:hypothetical protein GY45DRAFT_1066480 [Cubamyces sp. BRFM 1775]|nr:hypothetical protein GY45DRAFT_1066480 [Cubamyces sp. BRFM 1775]
MSWRSSCTSSSTAYVCVGCPIQTVEKLEGCALAGRAVLSSQRFGLVRTDRAGRSVLGRLDVRAAQLLLPWPAPRRSPATRGDARSLGCDWEALLAALTVSIWRATRRARVQMACQRHRRSNQSERTMFRTYGRIAIQRVCPLMHLYLHLWLESPADLVGTGALKH